MAVFCVNENLQLVTFSGSKLGQVSVLCVLAVVRSPTPYPFCISFLTEKVSLWYAFR